MSGGAWLASREIRVRRGRAAAAVAVVAAAAALVSAIETLSRLREVGVAGGPDAVGPSIVLRPGRERVGGAGKEPALLAPRTARAVEEALGRDLRRMEARLALPRKGASPAVVGVEAEALPGVPRGAATAGSALAEKLAAGSEATVAGREFQVRGVRPSSASEEDFALHVRLDDLQEALRTDGVSELRLHLSPGVDPARARRRLADARIPALVSGIDRGEVAERGLQGTLEVHREALYLFVGLVAGLALLVAAHLDSAERRTEVATLVAIGASSRTILEAVVARSALVSMAGAVLGATAGVGLAAALEPGGASAVLSYLPAVAVVPAAAVAIGAAAALPSAVASARRDPVPELQEGGA